MKKALLVFSLIFCISVSVISADNNYVQGEIIVMLKPNQNTSALSRDFGFSGLKVKESIVDYMNIWLFEYDHSRVDANVMLTQVRNHGSVVLAQFNHYVTQRSIMPNDPSFGMQWSLNNTGQNGGTPDADIDGPEAWNLTTSGLTAMGDTIVVAVVDGGAYLTHPDLKFWKNWYEIPSNNIDDDANGYIDDVDGWNAISQNGTISGNTHGSHCSGIAGALGNNSIGISGVNWNIKIMAVVGSSGTEAVVVRAYGYV
jgi:hypothetical protein